MTVNYVLQNSTNALIGKSADYLASKNIFEIASPAKSMACKLVYRTVFLKETNVWIPMKILNPVNLMLVTKEEIISLTNIRLIILPKL